MKNTGNTAKATVAIVFVLLIASVTLMANVSVQPVQAQNADYYTNQALTPPAGWSGYSVDTVAYLSYRPNVIGIGQSLLINMWVGPSVGAGGIYNNKTGAMQIVITKPDGTTETLIPKVNTLSELTSWLTYTPTAVGTYKIKFNFLGTYFPPQGSSNDVFFKPCTSPEFNFTVQQEMVSSWPPSPLPNDYWSWPVDFSHREWYTMLGSWPSTGYNFKDWGDYWYTLYPDTSPTDVLGSRNLFIPLVQGPNTGHVLRRSEEAIGGIYGGPAGITGQMADAGYPDVVYHGRCYDTKTRVMPTLLNGTYRNLPVSVAECFDLRTGEIYYDIPIADGGVTPTNVIYTEGTQPESDVPTFTTELIAISNQRLYKINPLTGAITTNVSVADLPGTTIQNNMRGYVIGVQDLGAAAGAERYRLINWTTSGTSTNPASRIIFNRTYGMSPQTGISGVSTMINYDLGLGVRYQGISIRGVGVGSNITGFNAYTGTTTWSINWTVPEGGTYYDPQALIADHGKFSVWTRAGPNGGKQVTWDMATGKLLWESETLSYPWAASGFSVYGCSSAYGMLFRASYAGLYAINWTDGKTVWFCPRYARASFESTYTEFAGGSEVYPGQTQVRIADGKIYIYDGEHSPGQPRTRGWSLYCIDAFTGKQIWNFAITGGISFSTPPSTGPIIDGYLYFPSTTGSTYIIGKGKSATTVAAPDVAVPLGTAFTIKGSVLDQSPAQPGTPCVSKDSMRTQMEYIHLAYPIDGIWHNETITGVPVALSAIGSDGTYYDIGTTTTDGYGGTYGLAWTPTKEGTYTIIANFAADDSYSSSMATTQVTVGPAPAQINIPQQITPPDYTMTIVGVGIGVIVAVVIAVAVAVLILRKK